MIILVSGSIKSGKDTLANFICSKLPFIKISIADKLKDYINKNSEDSIDEIIGKIDQIYQYIKLSYYLTF